MKRKSTEHPQEISASGEDPKALEEHIKLALYGGQRLLGPNGALTGMLQKIINSTIEGEMTNHLDESKASGVSNRRNGKLTKRVKSEGGEMEIITPCNREGSFQPQIVEKWGRTVNTGLNEHILSLYSLGNSVSDIQYHIKQIYGLDYG